MGDGWAWMSLSVYSDVLQTRAVAELMPGATPSTENRNVMAVSFSDGRDARLSELIAKLTDYLDQQMANLMELRKSVQFQLRIGWSPLSPQECIVLPSDLLARLAELGADLMIDTYSDDPIESN